nr:hypothetical protein [Anaerolineae bacterium]
MELKDIIKIFRRWWWLMVLLGLVGGSAAYILTPKPIPLYQASTTVLLSQGTDTLPDVDEITRGQRLADTYGQLMRSRPLLDEVISNLGLDYNANALSSAVAVSTLQGTNILTVSVTDTDPIRAADIANEIVSAFILENAEQENSRYAASRQSLEQELAALQLELETTQLELYYVDNDVEQLSADLQELDIRENQIGLTEAEQNLQGQIEQQLGELLIQQSQLKLQLNQQNTRYSTLLTSYEEVRLLEAQSFDILTVIEPALPGNRVSAAPRKTLNGLQGAVVGTILGFGIAFLINYLQSAV